MERTVTELYRAHVGFVERVLRRAGVAERDLPDASQEVFVVVHRRLVDFEGRASAQTWLYRIAWNVASEYRRRAFRRYELLDGNRETTDHVASPAEAVEVQQALAALLAAIDRLDAEKRDALIGHELDEQPMSAIATRLGIPLKTAFSRLYAAKRALEIELRKQGWACVAWWSLPFERTVTSPRPASRPGAAWLGVPAAGITALALLGLVPTPPLAMPYSSGAARPAELSRLAPRVPPALARPPRALEPQPTRAFVRRSRVRPAVAAQPREVALDVELTVVRTGQLELGLGPFGESPLADPPIVEPHRHPRAKLVLPARRRAGQ